MSSTLCVTVRSGLPTLHVNWRQSGMWSSVLRRPVSAHSTPRREQVLPLISLTSSFMINPGHCWSLLKTHGEKHFYSNIPPLRVCFSEAKHARSVISAHLKRTKLLITEESSQTAGKEFHSFCLMHWNLVRVRSCNVCIMRRNKLQFRPEVRK